MDYMTAFAISASGMTVERTRLEAIALNLANANSTRGPDGAPYRPLAVIARPRGNLSFAGELELVGGNLKASGVEVAEIRKTDVAPRLVFEPAHPDADEKGFVAYPGVNTVSEMLNLITATRSFEANVAAMNAAKSMVLRALEIGGN